jgi:hypothetical protein
VKDSSFHFIDYNLFAPDRIYVLKFKRLFMRRSRKNAVLVFLVTFGMLGIFMVAPKASHVNAQQPTGSIPTVTGTPTGPIIYVTYEEQINVRSGPSSRFYPVPIGIMYPGQEAPALGKSPGGDWIEIYFPGVPGNVGWVYAPLVTFKQVGFLPIVEPPPTPTPPTTPTIDPTLAAAFVIPATATRLPTFTPPPELVIPNFEEGTQTSASSRIPMGLVILSLAFIGGFGAIITYMRR